jgi:hypothetical protein
MKHDKICSMQTTHTVYLSHIRISLYFVVLSIFYIENTVLELCISGTSTVLQKAVPERKNMSFKKKLFEPPSIYLLRVGTTVSVPSSELGPAPPRPPCMYLLPRMWGESTRLRVRGWGSPNSDDRRKSLALCLLCGLNTR